MRSLFFIARHGETFLNESGKYRGWSNGPDAQLNEDGIESAHNAAQFLLTLNQKFSKIICSPMDRTQLTAAIIAEYFGITQIQIDDRLRPLNVGDFAGKPKSENPVQPYLKNKNKRFPGGETVNEFEARQHEFAMELLDLVAKAGDSEILVVAHVSNVMYWWNVQTSANSDEYLGETSDIVLPGGIAMVTENTTLPVFKENPKTEPDVVESKLDQTAAGYIPARSVHNSAGTQCRSCWKFIRSGSCVEVKGPIRPEQTCVQYVAGQPFTHDPAFRIIQLDPQVAGLTQGSTDCGKCEYFGGQDKCHKVRGFDGIENKEHIEAGGCCNSFEEKK